jgi:hypothetical protein
VSARPAASQPSRQVGEQVGEPPERWHAHSSGSLLLQMQEHASAHARTDLVCARAPGAHTRMGSLMHTHTLASVA